MPSKTKKQHNFMAAVANNPAFAKKVGIPRSVGEDFLTADKDKKFMKGGIMKDKMKMVAEKAVKGHEKRMHKMAGGGVTRADGCITKGHTKGKMIAMCGGGEA